MNEEKEYISTLKKNIEIVEHYGAKEQMNIWIEEMSELLTKQMLEDVFNDKKNNQKTMITISRADLYKFCIKLVKLIKRIEDMEE